MSLLNIFKKKEEEKNKKIEKKKRSDQKTGSLSFDEKERKEGENEIRREKKKTSSKKGESKKKGEKQKPKIEKKKGIIGFAYKILESPHITEKATDLSEKNKYIFKVKKTANKIEIKKAVKSVYGVNVIDVKIINIKRRKRRMGNKFGWKKGYKKAIVKVAEGEKIELLSR